TVPEIRDLGLAVAARTVQRPNVGQSGMVRPPLEVGHVSVGAAAAGIAVRGAAAAVHQVGLGHVVPEAAHVLAAGREPNVERQPEAGAQADGPGREARTQEYVLLD